MTAPAPWIQTEAAPPRREEGPRLERVREELVRAFTARPVGTWMTVTVPAPAVTPRALFEALPEEPALLWMPPEGAGVVGLGVVAAIDLGGERRCAALRAEAAQLFARLEVVGAPEAPPPRLYGGLAFAPGAAAGPPWREFSDGRFVLPRWRYLRQQGRAWLSLTLAGEASLATALETELPRLWARLADAAADEEGAGAAARVPVAAVAAVEEWSADGRARWREQMSPVEWSRLIEEIRGLIAAGACSKIVAARAARVEAGRPFQAGEVLARLGASQTGCTLFAFRMRATTFLGATPEHLVARHGSRLSTEALAGSIAAAARHPAAAAATAARDAGPAPPEELLASAKDRREHQLVVQAIVSALAPYCAWLDVPETPRVRALRHVLHLHTPITGELETGAHVLELVEALHPTPAVGGVPTRVALDWILRREPQPRGWYAAPIGWFDAAGDGEFSVALRCGVLDGTEATIYAGAGIIGDSEAAAEYRETALKQRALAVALGIEP